MIKSIAGQTQGGRGLPPLGPPGDRLPDGVPPSPPSAVPLLSRREIRKRALAARDSLGPDQRADLDARIFANLVGVKPFTSARTIFTYVSFRTEVDTDRLIRHALAGGQRVAVPLTRPAEAGLVAYLISTPEEDLRPGYCGIPEPDPGRAIPVAPAEIEVILLPGSAFDPQGGRLGYGGGYYDRFIAGQAPHALRIGLAYEAQVVPHLPLEPHDQRVHLLVTEDRVVTTGADQNPSPFCPGKAFP